MDKRISKSSSLLTQVDFKVNDKSVLANWFAPAVTAIFVPYLAPAAYFAGAQMREILQGGYILNAARGTFDYYRALKNGDLPEYYKK